MFNLGLRLIIVFSAMFLSVTITFGQGEMPPTPPPAKPATTPACPTISMPIPTPSVYAPTPITFTATLNSADGSVTPMYSWMISSGTIVSGQGTPSIKVDTADAGEYGSVTATLLVTGYSSECVVNASGTVEVKMKPVPRKISEYNESAKASDEESVLDTAIEELQNFPDNRLYLISYRSSKTKAGATEPMLQRAVTYMNKKGVSSDRIDRIYGDRKDPPAIEIWFIPPGAPMPKPAPVVKKP